MGDIVWVVWEDDGGVGDEMRALDAKVSWRSVVEVSFADADGSWAPGLDDENGLFDTEDAEVDENGLA